MGKRWFSKLTVVLLAAVMAIGFMPNMILAAWVIPPELYLYEHDITIEPMDSFAFIYNQDVKQGQAYAEISIRDDIGNQLPISTTLNYDNGTTNSGNRWFVVTPSVAWKPNTLYRLTIPANAIIDLEGNSMPSDLTKQFTTPSFVPQAIDISPRDGKTGYRRTVPIQFRFDQQISKSLNFNKITVKDSAGHSVYCSKSISPNGSDSYAIVITPLTILKANTQYTATVPANAVKEKYTGQPNAACSTTFTTGLWLTYPWNCDDY